MHTDAVEALGGVEDTLDEHPVQGEVAAQLILVEAELTLAQLGLPVGPVRAVDLPARQLTGELAFGGGVRGGRRGQVEEQVTGCTGGTCGLLGDDVIGVGAVAEQAGALRPQPHRFQQHRYVGIGATGLGGLIEARPTLRVRQHRLIGLHSRQFDGQHVAARAGLLAVGCGGVDTRLRQSRQLRRLIETHGELPRVGQQVAAELLGEHAQPLVEFGQTLFISLVQGRAASFELTEQPLVEADGLGVTGHVGLADEAVEIHVLVDRISVRRQPRHELGGDLIHLIGGISAVEIEEPGRHPVQHLPGDLQRLDGAGPGGFILGQDRRDLGVVLRQGGIEGRQDVLQTDGRKIRQLIGQR